MRFNKKKVVFLVLFGLLLINIFSVFVLSALGDTIINNQGGTVNINRGFGKVLDAVGMPSGNWKEVVLGIIMLLIIFAGLYDILQLISIFDSGWVKVLISGGLAIAFVLTGMVNKLTLGFMSFGAGLGATAIFIEIIVAIGIFIGLSLGNDKIARFAAKRKGQKEEIKAITAAGQASAAMTGLRQIQRNFKKNP